MSAVEYARVPGDHPVMRDVADLCYEVLHAPFGVTRDDRWDEMDPASTHFVALVDGKLAGYVRLIAEGGWAHLRQLAVYPEHQRRGIGSRLVEMALDAARGGGAAHAYLNARMNAVSLYERLGFRQVGAHFHLPRTYLPHIRMEMDL